MIFFFFFPHVFSSILSPFWGVSILVGLEKTPKPHPFSLLFSSLIKLQKRFISPLFHPPYNPPNQTDSQDIYLTSYSINSSKTNVLLIQKYKEKRNSTIFFQQSIVLGYKLTLVNLVDELFNLHAITWRQEQITNL